MTHPSRSAWMLTAVGITALGVLVGGVWGGYRGWAYLPTLPVAVVEGALIVGFPAALLGLLVGGLIALTTGHRGRPSHR